MVISLHGLDVSFLDSTTLPPKERKERPDFSESRSDLPSPHFMPDIAPFVSVATRDETVIGSRSELRAYEKRHGLRQVGDAWKPGEIVAENRAEKARIEKLAASHMAEAKTLGADTGWQETP